MSQLLLDGDGLGISNLTNTGILNALPNAIQLPGCNILSLLTISFVIFGTIFLIYSTSTGCNILNIRKLLHCDKDVSESSEGRWDISPNKTPYFLPSFVIRSKIL